MINETRYRITAWCKTGASEGGRLGFLIGYRYMFATTLFLGLLGALDCIGRAVGERSLEPLERIIAGTALLIFVWCVGFCVGLLPAAVVGAVIGGIVGLTTALPSVYNSRLIRCVTGIGTVVLLALVVANPVLNRLGVDNADRAWHSIFWYFIGVPFVFCLGAILWLSDRLPILAPTPMPYEMIAQERPVLPPLWLE